MMMFRSIHLPRLHRHFGGAIVGVGLMLLFSSTTTRSSVTEASATLPLHLDRHFPEFASLTPPAPARGAVSASAVSSESRARYLQTLPFGSEIRAAARSASLDSLLVASVVEAESGFRADAISPKGAMGLMQLMPLHFEQGQQPFDPKLNLMLGTRYLAELKQRYDGDLELALAAYHAGPGAVEKWGGVPPYQETHRYVGRVLSLYERHRASLAARSDAGALARVPIPVEPQRGS
jgi:hypothetical protein